MRKAGGCDVTDTGVPERNLVLTSCKVGFCNREIDTEAEERGANLDLMRNPVLFSMMQ